MIGISHRVTASQLFLASWSKKSDKTAIPVTNLNYHSRACLKTGLGSESSALSVTCCRPATVIVSVDFDDSGGGGLMLAGARAADYQPGTARFVATDAVPGARRQNLGRETFSNA